MRIEFPVPEEQGIVLQAIECVRVFRFGFVNPILTSGEGEIIAGHGRLEAARLLGLAEVPVLGLTHLSPAERRAYVIADNRLAELAGWDTDILAAELGALIEIDFDVEFTGFALAEIDTLLGAARDADPASPDPEGADQVPPIPAGPAVTRPGDLWQLGPHRLICADARDDQAMGRLLDGEAVDLIFTGPPYKCRSPAM